MLKLAQQSLLAEHVYTNGVLLGEPEFYQFAQLIEQAIQANST